MQKKQARIVQCGLAVLWGTGLTAQAQVVPVPPDLALGDQYRLMFVTDTLTRAVSTDIATDIAVAAAAVVSELDALGATWTAMASTTSVDARDNTGTDPTPGGPTGVPVYLIDGTRLADNYDQLWNFGGAGNLYAPPKKTASGAAAPTLVWTGTNVGGTGIDQLGLSNPGFGLSTSGDSTYLRAGTRGAAETHPLYGMSEVLSTTAPDRLKRGCELSR